MIRLIVALALVTACISQAKQAIAPEPDGTGTLSCREIVEQCDSQCSDPLCLSRCSSEGNADGAAQHQALLDCGQRNSCTDQECMEANCPAEIQTCTGEAATPAADAPEQQDPQQEPVTDPAQEPTPTGAE